MFRIKVKEKEGKLLIKSFNGEIVQAPLSELTKFTFDNKSLVQYTFLFLSFLIPIFVFTTFVIMLLSKMTTKQKLIWSAIILIVALPKFWINWNSDEGDFQILNISFWGGGMTKPNLFSAWLISFHILIGR